MNDRLISLAFAALIVSSAGIAQDGPFQRSVTPFPVLTPGGAPYTLPMTGGLNRPVQQFVDIDNDGDQDLFIRDVANQLIFFRNIGTPQAAEFEWVTDTYGGLPIGGWFRFVDTDGDGDKDLFADSPLSNMSFFRNEGTPETAFFVQKTDTLRDEAGDPVYVEIPTVPSWADIDCDGDMDMFLGRLTGEIAHFLHVGVDPAGIPVFQHVTEAYQELLIVTGGDDCMMTRVSNDGSGRHGASAMAFADFDADLDADLFWGDFFAQSILLLGNDGSCQTAVFDSIQEQFPEIGPVCTGGFNIPDFTDIDADGDMDMFVGVQGGAYSLTVDLADNILFYENSGTPAIPLYELRSKRYLSVIDIGDKSVPAVADIDNDGDFDLLLGNEAQPEADNSGRLHFFRNDGSAPAPSLSHSDTNYLALTVGFNYAPAFVDIDGDGDKDIVMGEWTGMLNLLRNDGTPESPSFVLADQNYFGIDVGNNSTPAFADIDNDGDQDMFIGEFLGTINFYRNEGTAQVAAFVLEDDTYMGIDTDLYSAPAFIDIDHDTDYDLFVGSDLMGVLFYRNEGTPEVASFVEDTTLAVSFHNRTAPVLADMDGDGDHDLLLGIDGGGLVYYRNTDLGAGVDAGFAPESPERFLLVRSYPNPFNPEATIEFEIRTDSEVSVTIFSMNGEIIEKFRPEQLKRGTHRITWNAAGRASGLYFAFVRAGSSVQSVKLLLLK